MPFAMRPLWLEDLKRRAGFVVSEARICWYVIAARDMSVN
jgi:hypothetical protein